MQQHEDPGDSVDEVEQIDKFGLLVQNVTIQAVLEALGGPPGAGRPNDLFIVLVLESTDAAAKLNPLGMGQETVPTSRSRPRLGGTGLDGRGRGLLASCWTVDVDDGERGEVLVVSMWVDLG